ncbi:GNAT family N-acetyltransferase [Frigoribacterium sp. PhB24]|uniref:GNAT family N-acetyltransferase n=1 Tax=Frigoribacterium sp. PhB24 TaxID=2485204 RepID=UPI000F4956E3|nr:GNAT family N-acetyltransferase [Frigoribacterium sp. PhB24]
MIPSVRPAVLEDVPSIARLFLESFDPDLHPFLTQAQRGASRFMSLPFLYPHMHGHHRVYVVTISGRIAGYADFRLMSSGQGFLSYLAVASWARGRGLASSLIHKFLSAEPMTTLTLDVFTSNVAANALYEKIGFSHGPVTTWATRELPEATVPEAIGAFSVQQAAFDTYGFSEFLTESGSSPERFGRIGHRVLRCFNTSTFENDRQLARVRASFPQMKIAFGTFDSNTMPAVPHEVIVRSERRVLTVSPQANPSGPSSETKLETQYHDED